MSTLKYDLLIAESAPPRHESINVGVLLWRESGLEVRNGVTAHRLAALDPNYPRLPVFQALLSDTLGKELGPRIDAVGADEEVRRALLHLYLGPMRALPGGVIYAEATDCSAQIEQVLDALVRRPDLEVPSMRKPTPRSLLEQQVRDWLRRASLMGRGMEDLSKHRVVAHFPVSVEADIYADFAYRNGTLNVIETLDLRGTLRINQTVLKTAALKSITLDMARDAVGHDGKRIGVIATSDYAAVKPAVRVFERNASEVFALDNPGDAQQFADLLAKGLRAKGTLSGLALVP